MPNLRVFTFSPDWGLPSVGPFAIKLLAWLELAGIAYEQVIEDAQGSEAMNMPPGLRTLTTSANKPSLSSI